MAAEGAVGAQLARQHIIDPEVCIRCNTCEATCPTGAVTHDLRNYVVKFDLCNGCGACISPCPTGAIDHWRQVLVSKPYTLEQQFSWDALPEQQPIELDAVSGVPDEVIAATATASAGQGGVVNAPWSAATPTVNLYSLAAPALARVVGNFRLTDADSSSDIRHIVLDFGALAMPVLEGQTIGIIPPGTDASGRPHHIRLYSVASPRDGERPNYNNLSLTVKRVTHDHDGSPVLGVCSNYMCDLKTGDEVNVVGPYGTNFLMPNHPGANLLMICTGTGSAPMRAMTERRRRQRASQQAGKTVLFFGARASGELPYFGPLMKLDKAFINVNLALSRVPGQPREYVQDKIRARGAEVAALLSDPETYVYICGLKGMEAGVDAAFADACRAQGIDWQALLPQLRHSGRYHVETY
jgi:benzoyl-CoA 2,3-dioxygenase component A